MSHVDEGALNAYLDGALEEYPAAEAARVRAHLDVCAECRDRLEEERAVRDRASSILGVAAPPVDLPSLEELRSHLRVRDRRARPTSTRLYRLGWAASIVLALGVGWLVRGERVAPSAGTNRAASVEPTASAAERPGNGTGVEAAPAPADRADAVPAEASDAGVPSPPAPVRLNGTALLPSDTPLPGIDGGPSSEPSRGTAAAPDIVVDLGSDAPPLPDAPRLEDTIVPPVLTPDLLVDAPVPARRGAAPSRETRSGVGVVSSATAAAPTPGIDALGPTLAVGDVDHTRTDEADGETSYSLVVPGLDVLDVRFRGAGVRPEGQVALQRLESGDTLTVIHLPREVELSSLETPAPGDRQIVVETSSGWIVMRAPVAEDALLDLMRRLLSVD